MKKIRLIILIAGISLSSLIQAQSLPDPPAAQGTAGDQRQGGQTGAPIDSGLSILLVLAAGYAYRKVNQLRSTGE